jgi:hypothetical protein
MKKRLPILFLTAGSLLLAGCGGGKTDTTADDNATPDASASPSASAGAVEGTFAGTFSNVPKPPDGSPAITGTATMIVSATGTKVTVSADGLDPKAVYVAHVHDDACAADDPGGAHFKFDPAGADKPPNEIHVTTIKVTGKTGTGNATVAGKATGDARSVVIHVKRAAGAKADEAKPPKLACADLVKQ